MGRKSALSNEQKNNIEKLFNDNFSIVDISKDLDLPYDMVFYYVKTYMTPKHIIIKQKCTPEIINEIKMLVNNKNTISQIANKLNLGYQTVYNWMKANKINPYKINTSSINLDNADELQRLIIYTEQKFNIKIPTDIDKDLQEEFCENIYILGKEYTFSWYKNMKKELECN